KACSRTGLTRSWPPECAPSRAGRVHQPAAVIPPPVDRTVQSGGASLTVLLEAQVNSRQIAVVVCDAVDGEPTRESIAAAPLARPAEAPQRRVIEGVALEVGVITGLELGERARRLKLPGPLLVSLNTEGEVATVRGYRKDGVGLRVAVVLTPADVITWVALELHVVRGRRPAKTGDA